MMLFVDPICLRCGACCFLVVDGVRSVPCKHLVRLSSGKTLCRVYNQRIGLDLGCNNFCSFRVDLHENFPDCPFNRPEWVGLVDGIVVDKFV